MKEWGKGKNKFLESRNQLTDGTLYKRFKTMRNKASIEEHSRITQFKQEVSEKLPGAA